MFSGTDVIRPSFVPETKGRELEELDETFNGSTREFASFHWMQGVYAVKRYVLRLDGLTPPPAPIGRTPTSKSTGIDFEMMPHERN